MNELMDLALFVAHLLELLLYHIIFIVIPWDNLYFNFSCMHSMFLHVSLHTNADFTVLIFFLISFSF